MLYDLHNFFFHVHAWIYEYFPCFRPSQLKEVDAEIPRTFRWLSTKGAVKSREKLIEYRQMIDNLTAEHVDWNPYKSDVSQEFPHTLFEGMIRCHNIIEPYNQYLPTLFDL
ncbi:hypothetical protein Leryth_018050 [Lithospermum erythrorhizon]|nr:hypothetical protein Leryth_018050 [Lithospermum erythrorhizon]